MKTPVLLPLMSVSLLNDLLNLPPQPPLPLPKQNPDRSVMHK